MFKTLSEVPTDLTIRRLGPADGGALAWLAQRDSAAIPEGTVYGALAPGGSLLAAISLESRALVADPFHHTAHAAKLLGVWARQLGAGTRHRWTRGGMAVSTPATAVQPSSAGC
jgi:hypothetical protein